MDKELRDIIERAKKDLTKLKGCTVKDDAWLDRFFGNLCEWERGGEGVKVIGGRH